MYDPSNPHANTQDFDPYQDFDTPDLKPEAGIKADVKVFPVGEYTCVIQAAGEKASPKNPSNRMVTIDVTMNGAPAQYTWWLTDQRSVNAFTADMCILAPETNPHQWGKLHGRPLVHEIPKAVALLPGRQFKASRADAPKKDANGNPKPNEFFNNFYVGCLIGGKPMPNGSASAQAPQAVTPPPPQSRPSALRFWYYDAVGAKSVELTKDGVQALCDQFKDASQVTIQDFECKSGWKTAADFGFTAVPF